MKIDDGADSIAREVAAGMRADRGSGTVAYDSPSSERIESYARLAYSIAKESMRRPRGMGRLLEALIACEASASDSYRILLVDEGVERGQAQLEFSDGHEPHSVCRMVRMLEGQSNAELSMACARACALFVAWVRGEEWGHRLLDTVALAIAMPEPGFRAQMQYLNVEQLSEAYVVDPADVLERLGMFRTSSGSGERAAITGLVP
jgi:hypothetical protein